MISIDGIELSDDLVWENEFDEATVAIAVNHTLGGRAVVDAMGLDGGREINIVAERSGESYTGSLLRSQVIALYATMSTAQTVTFIYETQSIQVKISSIDVRPIVMRPNPSDDDEYTGTITLIEV
jgi:hypothetical protein